MPETQTPYEEKCHPTSTLASLKDSWAPPYSVISATDSHSLGETPTETVQEDEMSVDKMDREDEPNTQESGSSIKLCEEEKTEVKSNKHPCPDINRSEFPELTAPSLEERIETRESKTPDQVLSPLSAMEAHSLESDNLKEEAECASLIQEMNVGFPPTEAPESLENGDLKIQQECTPSLAEESTDVHHQSAVQNSNSGFRSHEERRNLKEVLFSDLEKDSEVKSCKNLKEQEQAILECKSTEAKNESFESEMETDSRVKVEELDESKILLVTQNEEGNANVVEEPSNVAHQDSNEKQLGWPSDKVPQIQISSCIEDIKPAVPDLSLNEHFIIPKIEIMEPELKEYTLPLTILAPTKTESEPTLLQKHDATEVIIQEQSVTDSSDLLPTQKGMQNDYNTSPTEIVKEVQLNNTTEEMFEQEQTRMKSSEHLTQMDYATIPVINVSCTDDKDDVNTHAIDTPRPKLPLFVVPPISVRHESDLRLSTLCESTETESSVATQRGTKLDVDNNMTTKPEKTQHLEEVAEKSITENTPSMLFEAPMPKAGDNVPSLSKATEDNTVPEILKTKPLKEAKTENSVTVEDLLRNRSSVERLTFKPPTHPSLSPASLRKFMSKAAPDSDTEAVTAVPVITVGDRQGDKADEDLSGGSTPTSSLSCESSPRLKRRDSLSLIRSATPEELASGARRKIFIPKTKEDGEGVGGVSALDSLSKKETPYMSPSQARRAALLQAPMGQNTPPMERRSPLLSRRKATLEVPKVVEETPTEEPVSTKKEEKPAEKKLDPLKGKEVHLSVKICIFLSCATRKNIQYIYSLCCVGKV